MKYITSLKRTNLLLLISYSFSLSAQTASVVTDTKTDKQYANTTEIYKSEKATDSEVLAEIENNFGLGDVVRIAIAPPKPKLQNVPKNNSTIPVKNTDIALVSSPKKRTEVIYIELKTTPSVTKPIEPNVTAIPVAEKVNTPVATTTPETLVTETIENKEVIAPSTITAVENNTVVKTNRTLKSANSVKNVKSTKSVKASSKKSFSLFNNFSLKSTKHVKSKGGKKYGCYRF